MQLSIKVQRTDEELSGVVEGVIPSEYRSDEVSNDELATNMTHHWTNIGITT